MTTLSLLCRFPLGTYTGHQADGGRDPLPDPARLLSALLHAAATGSTAVAVADGLAPSEESLEALRWLESRNPAGLLRPRCSCLGVPGTAAHRAVSAVNASHRTELRPVSDGTALDGPVGYRWEQVPEDVATAIERLLPDVGCLGEATSPVVVERADFTPTHLLGEDQSYFAESGERVRVPTEGRIDALLAAHSGAGNYPRKRPTKAKDRLSWSEWPSSSAPPKDCLAEARYVAPEPPMADAPWDQVVLLELGGGPVPSADRVTWCSTLHRALIALIGYGTPPLITGKYPRGMRRPANRMAIQYLAPEHVTRHGVEGPALGLLIPRDAAASDLAELHRALTGLRELRCPVGRRQVRFSGVGVRAEEFWPEPEAGLHRRWVPDPAVVPETRPQRDGDRPWTLADAGLLSLAFVWRDEFDVPGRGAARYRGLVEVAESHGAAVHRPSTMAVDGSRFVHRLPEGVPAQPYTAVFDLGALAGPRTLVAVGQSRHLGGGLLVPLDVPGHALPLIEGTTGGSPR